MREERARTTYLSDAMSIQVSNGRHLFGYFKGLPYTPCVEDFDEYRTYKNSISKDAVISHIEGLMPWYAFGFSRELFTGEYMHQGLYDDGEFTFPLEFLHYYKYYDIGIPYEYEEYLKSIGVK